MNEIGEIIKKIRGLDESAMKEARERQDYLAKVPGSLGVLEDISIRLAGITGKAYGNDVSDQAIILMCADNGVVEEGVASAPQSVTLSQTINFTKGITGVSSQARYFCIDLLVVDIGVNGKIPEEFLSESMTEKESGGEPETVDCDDKDDDKDATKAEGSGSNNISLTNKIVNRRIACGTNNFAKEPAMTREEAICGIMVGVEAAEACKNAGKTLIGVGEMGIGNTTTASAIIAAFACSGAGALACIDIDKLAGRTGGVCDVVDTIVGRGGGLSDEGLEKKRAVIKDALNKYAPTYMNIKTGEIDPIELLACIGGFDIAGMVGAYLGAAANRLPALIDGVISLAAALLAVEMCPTVKDFLFASHKSTEGGYAVASKILGLDPMYDLGMRLGEGSGCPIAFKIIEAACATMNGMKTLDEAKVEAGYLDEFRGDGQFL
ncbi:MAG: nicotinate-nucleotide--dimethylbenzimidazole phosphoribosyltransferase [Firmicutes bacterium]|nr:nicotinate-nucleotide--dimethylbenzimidazole phosphoribosyltransferase [Bacillota bacterium]